MVENYGSVHILGNNGETALVYATDGTAIARNVMNAVHAASKPFMMVGGAFVAAAGLQLTANSVKKLSISVTADHTEGKIRHSLGVVQGVALTALGGSIIADGAMSASQFAAIAPFVGPGVLVLGVATAVDSLIGLYKDAEFSNRLEKEGVSFLGYMKPHELEMRVGTEISEKVREGRKVTLGEVQEAAFKTRLNRQMLFFISVIALILGVFITAGFTQFIPVLGVLFAVSWLIIDFKPLNTLIGDVMWELLRPKIAASSEEPVLQS